jgi:hypothetical protein
MFDINSSTPRHKVKPASIKLRSAQEAPEWRDKPHSWRGRRFWARQETNAPVGDWSDHFTFIVGDHRYHCPSSATQFLSPQGSKLHSIDATISELRLEVEDRDKLFGSVLEAAKGDSIAVDSDYRGAFKAFCTALWNSELYRSVYPELGDEVAMESVADPLQFLSGTRCDISAELEFIASYFYDFLGYRDGLRALSFSMIYEIISHGSLRIESEDGLCDFICKGSESASV